MKHTVNSTCLQLAWHKHITSNNIQCGPITICIFIWILFVQIRGWQKMTIQWFAMKPLYISTKQTF